MTKFKVTPLRNGLRAPYLMIDAQDEVSAEKEAKTRTNLTDCTFVVTKSKWQ
jgi:hypothetical protein